MIDGVTFFVFYLVFVFILFAPRYYLFCYLEDRLIDFFSRKANGANGGRMDARFIKD